MWEPKQYTVTYWDVGYTESVYNTKDTATLKTLTKKGYNFIGWKDRFSNELITTIQQGNTKNIQVIAQWEPIVFSMEWNLNGGTLAIDNPATYTIVEYQWNIPTIYSPQKEGYIFLGWTEPTLYTTPTIITEAEWTYKDNFANKDLTFTANWTAIEYNITYNLNEGINNSANPKTYTIEQEVCLQDPERKGYKFIGWTDGGLISKGSIGEKTFTASWQIIDYKIIYVLNGGTNNKLNKTSYNVLSGGFYIYAPDCPISTIKKDGYDYEFIGWSGTNLEDAENKTVYIENGSVGDLTVTANFEWKWIPNTKIIEGAVTLISNKETDTWSICSLNDESVTDIDLSTCTKKITKIADSAFYQTNITSIILPDTIEYIGNFCFHYANNLKTISLSKSLKYIGRGTFPGAGITINYAGTKAEWDAIEKHSEWNYNNARELTINYLGDTV